MSSAVRRSVPVRTFGDWNDPVPGYVEVDFVAHSGTSSPGRSGLGRKPNRKSNSKLCCKGLPRPAAVSYLTVLPIKKRLCLSYKPLSISKQEHLNFLGRFQV